MGQYFFDVSLLTQPRFPFLIQKFWDQVFGVIADADSMLNWIWPS
jgi:hypothetical protein